jgi:hypothetical protein
MATKPKKATVATPPTAPPKAKRTFKATPPLNKPYLKKPPKNQLNVTPDAPNTRTHVDQLLKMVCGRPSVYNSETSAAIDKVVYEFELLGMTDAEIARFFQIHPDTLAQWDKKYPSFYVARARGREYADGEVVRALHHRAIGYTHKAKKFFSTPQGILEVEYDEHYPPDANSAALWLTNRRKDKWKSKPDDSDASGGSTVRIIGGLPDD